MIASQSAGRLDRTNTAHRAAKKLRQSDKPVRLTGRKVLHPFRHPLYQESMLTSFKRRIEGIVGCSVRVEPKYNRRNKLVSLTVQKLNTSQPA